MAIESLTGQYAKLDNTHRLQHGIPIVGRDGIILGQARSVEQAYFMLRALHDVGALAVMRATTGINGKAISRDHEMKGNWVVKVACMLRAVEAAVALNPDIATLLDETGDQDIAEGNEWNDPVWGRIFIQQENGRILGPGYNLTGRAWMFVRDMRRSPDYAAPDFAREPLDRADTTRFMVEAQALLDQAGFDPNVGLIKLKRNRHL